MVINWGSVADWASAFGSVSAAIVALYLARSSQRVKLSVMCGIRTIVGGGIPPENLVSMIVTNAGERPFKISSITVQHGVFKKQHGFIKIGAATQHCESLFRLLNDGDQAHFGFPLEDEHNWVSAMARDCRTDLDISTIRLTIHCSNGQSLKFKPEKPVLEFIREKMRKLQRIEVKVV
ncbi:hypothetical protein [Pseudomonas sp. AP3_22 TE3818]